MKRILTAAEVTDLLRTVQDPEVGMNIVDLGLVYDVHVTSEAIDLEIGFTVAACPMRHVILSWIHTVLQEHSSQQIRIDTDSAPPWTPARMNLAGNDSGESGEQV